MAHETCPTCGSSVSVVGDTTRHFEPVTSQRVVSSAANFYLGETLRLRPDMGGGEWVVVELLPRKDYFARAVIERRA